MTTHATQDADAPERGIRVRASLPSGNERTRGSLVASVLVHGAVVLLAVYATSRVVEPPRGGAIMDALTFATGGGGGGGQGGRTFVAVAPVRVAPPPPEALVSPPETVVLPPPPASPAEVPTVTAPPRDSAPTSGGAVGAGSGGGTGGGQGTGTGPGSGSGTGPGSGGGSGGGVAVGARGTDPESRQLMVPPLDAPKALRGRTVAVTFVVAADGRVVDIDVVPPIADRDYSRKFDEVMRSYRFRPARDPAGVAVAGTTTVEVTF